MGHVLVGLMCAGTAIWVLRFLLLWHFRRHVSTLAAEPSAWPSGTPLPRVSIIVPAKDEEANIGACARSLLAQDYPDFEVIVVDDRSKDRTAEIVAGLAARDRRLRLIRNTELADGWSGKCYALALGQTRADGDWLLFTDADTIHGPTGLRSALTAAEAAGAEVFTLLPAVETEGLLEGALQPCLAGVLLSLFPPSLVNGRPRGLAFANGQYLLIRRAAYDRLGGHEAVRGAFLEDIALARRAREAGLRVGIGHGASVVRTRMYRGLRAICQGWSRIFHASGRPASVLALAIAASLLTTLLPVGVLVGSALVVALGRSPDTPWALLLVALAEMGLMLLCMGIFYRLGRCRLRCLVLHPLATAVAVGILANAVRLRCFGGTVTWRGTTYRRHARAPRPSPDGVVPAFAEGVAAQDPPDPQQRADQ